jgi:hypothetical protein
MKSKYFFENIFFISLLLFLIKWFFFFDTSFNIDISTKLIYEMSDWQYFTLISNLSELNFNPSYNPELLNLKSLPLPIYSIFYHAVFFNFFNIYGFIIIEFFIIYIFFYILTNFFIKLNIDKIEAIFLTLFLFCLQDIIFYFQLNKFEYFGALTELYNLRIPRPSITHLYLFIFFSLLISNQKKIEFKIKKLILIGLLFAMMFGSFYYNLVISGTTFLLYYFYISYKSDQKILKYIKDFLTVLFCFIFFSVPLFIILLNSEPDYLVRVGLINLDYEKKKLLLEHFLKKLQDIKFIIFFILITILNFFLKTQKKYNTEGLNLLYIIFLSSFLGPIIFIVTSPTISEAYHFTNMIVYLTFFVLMIYLFLTAQVMLNIFFWFKYLFKFLIIFLLSFYSLSNYTLSKNNHFAEEKSHHDQIIKFIKKLNIHEGNSILTFDTKLQTSLILNNYKNLVFVSGINIPLNDETIENQIINIFKFLKLDENDFNDFIKNEKYGWRFINVNIAETFYMKYQANTLKTYNDSLNFSDEEKNYILKSSPLHSQQLIIPIFEIERLMTKYENFSNFKKINPELIIINNKKQFNKNVKLDNDIYCRENINNTFDIYLIKSKINNC